MRKVLIAITVVVVALTALAATAQAVTSGAVASGNCSAAVPPGTARLTINFLKIKDRPIRTSGLSYQSMEACLAYGTVWEAGSTARPGEGQTMVIYGHDVTDVHGYSHDAQGYPHGPFYWLNRMKRGETMKILWRGKWWHYRLAAKPHAHRQCASKRANKSSLHLNKGEAMCAPDDQIVDKPRRVETVLLMCCWPRHHRWGYMTARFVLVTPEPKT